MCRNIPKLTMITAIFLYLVSGIYFVDGFMFYSMYVVVPILGLIGSIASSKIEGNPFMLVNIIIFFAPIILFFLSIAFFGFV